MIKMCSIKKCSNESYGSCEISYYSVPKDPEIKKKWIRVMHQNKIVTKSTLVCARHFKKNDYIPSTLQHKFRKLKPEAVPSIFPGMPEWVKFKKHYIQSKNMESDGELDEQSDCDDDNKTDCESESDTIFDEINNEDLNKVNDEKINEIRPQRNIQSNKIMVITPISDANGIADVIASVSDSPSESKQCSSVNKSKRKATNYQPLIKVKRFLPNLKDSVGITEKLNPNIGQSTQNRNNVMVIGPITDNKCIEDIISVKSELPTEISSPVDNGHTSTSSNIFEVKSMNIVETDEVQIKAHENKHFQSHKAKQNKDVSTQTRQCSIIREKFLQNKVKCLQQKLNRRVTAYKQLKTVIQLIKQCKDFSQIQQVMAIKVKQIPEALNCDSIIIATPHTTD